MAKRKASVLGRSQDDMSIDNLVEPPPQAQRVNVVTNANGVSVDVFRRRYVDEALLTFTTSTPSTAKPEPTEEVYSIVLKTAGLAGTTLLSSALLMIEQTQMEYYLNSSFGWNLTRKKAEMREKAMRYLFVCPPIENGGPIWPLIAYLSFMLTFDSTPSVPVLYIYELHVRQDDNGRGLGTHLLRLAEDIARQVGVDKIMLTCFLSNEKALAFYQRHGYIKDVCSPEDRLVRNRTVKVDYWIMSKKVAKREALKEVQPS